MTARRRILVVDDERDLAELLHYNLTKSGYDVAVSLDGRDALERIGQSPPDLILLDVMLPRLSGTEVASRLRSNPATAHMPIIMLTAKSEEIDQLVGLTVGADDYVVKPFSMKVLLARVEAVLRRAASRPSVDQRVLTMGDLSMNLETHEAAVASEPMKLTLTEFRLLSSLLQGGGRILSRADLMSKAMGPGVLVTERTIDVHITSIRKKLGPLAGIVKTVRGVGYRVTPELEDAHAGDDAAVAD